MMRYTFAVVIAVTLTGCSIQPAKPEVAASVPTAPAPAAPAATTASSMVSVPAADSTQAPAKVKVPQGYRAKTRDGVTVYCKNIAPIGTRFKEEVCLTSEQVEQLERQGAAFRDEMTRRNSICGTPGGSCGG